MNLRNKEIWNELLSSKTYFDFDDFERTQSLYVTIHIHAILAFNLEIELISPYKIVGKPFANRMH